MTDSDPHGFRLGRALIAAKTAEFAAGREAALPMAMRCQQITEDEADAIRRIAADPNATVGVLNWTPKRLERAAQEQPR